MGSGWRSRMVDAWREDHLGDRDLTSWPSAVGRGVVAATGCALDRVRRAFPTGSPSGACRGWCSR